MDPPVARGVHPLRAHPGCVTAGAPVSSWSAERVTDEGEAAVTEATTVATSCLSHPVSGRRFMDRKGCLDREVPGEPGNRRGCS